MNRQSSRALSERVAEAAERVLSLQAHVSVLEVFLGIGWIDPGTVKRWQWGEIEHLETAIQTRPERVSEAIMLLQSWAAAKGLVASETPYVARRSQRQPLRFSRSGGPEREQAYRTHWISGAVSERQRVAEKARRAPDLVVIQPLKSEWTCHRCGGTGGLLIMENPGPACLRCTGLDDLEFLPAGDALRTRRAKAKSARYAVVMRFSKTRGRYERQGILVEAAALGEAEWGLAKPER
jgi:hypothetical protein